MLKKFKFGFAAIIAVLAISATLASYAGAFKNTKLEPTANGCYREIKLTASGNFIQPSICGEVDLCAVDFRTPGTCEDSEAACCFIVTETDCVSGTTPGKRVLEIACGDFVADTQ